MNLKTAISSIAAPSDQRLALIANRAAIEFDKALQNDPIGFESTEELSRFLRSEFGQSAEGTSSRSIDLIAFGVLGQTLQDAQQLGTSSKVSDILSKLQELTKAMEAAVKVRLDDVTLKNLREFCIALSNRIVAERETIQQSRPRNPFRR